MLMEAKTPDARAPITIAVDIGYEENCKKVVEELLKEYGQIDILVNNAAEQHFNSVEEITESRLERVFQTNIFSQFFMCRHALKHMKQVLEKSSIINSTSVTAYTRAPTLLDYCGTKGAIVAFSRSLALQLVEKGIRFNCVAPGAVWTPL
ncbi:hypothetical protein SLA2020_096880 [Shorea laevis]